jgi:phosphoenolpyruvate-protein kinase (PTS system EI component)
MFFANTKIGSATLIPHVVFRKNNQQISNIAEKMNPGILRLILEHVINDIDSIYIFVND